MRFNREIVIFIAVADAVVVVAAAFIVTDIMLLCWETAQGNLISNI